MIGFQEEVGLDVLVHGEPERNDMVQYFAEQMEGYVFTQNAWVQSYGSRYVRPADPVRRRQPACADDGRLDRLRAVADRAAGEGHAHRAGDDAPVVVRPRRPATLGDLQAARARDPRRGRRPRGRRRRSSRWTSRRSARACRCAATAGTSTWSGRSTASGSRPRGPATRPRSTPTCATRTSATSWSRSSRWTPTCC